MTIWGPFTSGMLAENNSNNFMPLLSRLCLLLLLIGNVQAAIEFDGKPIRIPLGEWQRLMQPMTLSPEQMADNPQQFHENLILPHSKLLEEGRQALRLELYVSYDGPQRPMIIIPYAFVPELQVGLFQNGKVLFWQTLDEHMRFGGEESLRRMTGLVNLPITAPGRYQFIIQGNEFINTLNLREARIHLDTDYLLRDYPAIQGKVTGILGALMINAIFFIAVLIYRFNAGLMYALMSLLGTFLCAYIHEGVIFLEFDLDASWWVANVLTMATAITHFSILFFIGSDFNTDRWRWGRRTLCIAGVAILFAGLVNLFFPVPKYYFPVIIGLGAVVIGYVVALLMMFSRAITEGIRERLFALIVGLHMVLVVVRIVSVLFVDHIYISTWFLYGTMSLVGVFVFVEFLLINARVYAQEKTRKTADMARVDLVNRFSHELRTPLNAVIGLADLMKGSSSVEKVDNYANLIQRAGHSLLELVNDILDFSKLGGEGVRLVEQPVRLDRLMTDVMMSFVPQAMETGILPVSRVEPGVPFFLLTDDLRLRQIFSNLINNAVKFSSAGQQVNVNVKTGQQLGDRIELICTVKDEGRGIPEEMLDTIFEPYTQTNAEDGGHLRGTGLGLAICRLLVREMGGEISVTSELGKGSLFTFNLWVKLNPAAPDLQECFSALQGKYILLVSSNPSISVMFAELLQFWGATIAVAESCRKAPMADYDCVIVDSMYNSAEACIPWLNQLPESTAIEVSEIKCEDWVENIQHPRVNRLLVPIATLDVIALLIRDMTGEQVDLSCGEKESRTLTQVGHEILLVDDNKVNLTVASKLLESIGVHCDTAENGLQALERLHSEKCYSLVLLDCEMPDISGFEVCRRWRRHEQLEQLARLPIIALTAHALGEVSEACFQAGMDDVRFKPIDREALVELLNNYPGVDFRQLVH